MGICLDTEQSDGAQAFEEGRDTWVRNSAHEDPRSVATPPDGRFPMLNRSPVNFESPKVPVIFVLGGPGSGKVTHCDNLMQEKKGIIHINMTDLLQQYAIGNDMQDFGMLSSKTVTEVLMLEMKMAPMAKTYLVSGYPRNMRDVVEYSEKIQVVNGAILISWRQKVLERQIDYGAKLGQVVLSLARMELSNFYKNVMPVADYFDQSNMLISVNGERHPGDVYKDFRASVFRILGMQPVQTLPQPSMPIQEAPKQTNGGPPKQANGGPPRQLNGAPPKQMNVDTPRPQTQVISVSSKEMPPTYQSPIKPGWPPVLWVIGGPGSNKAALCIHAAKDTGWTHISLGRLLRAAAEPPDPKPGSDPAKIRDCIAGGEMVPLDIIMKVVESHMASNMDAQGIILDGFPRDMAQATEFEAKYKQKPTIILLDCSKLQLGRGRLDDSVTAFRRRLEIFRQSSLPMLKAMDNIGRLTIVDGDTDTQPVQEDFKNVVKEHIRYIKENSITSNGNGVANSRPLPNGIPMPNQNGVGPRKNSVTIHDLESDPIQTISRHVAQENGIVRNGVARVTNGFANGHVEYMQNGFGRNKYTDLNAERQENIRQMYGEVNYMDGHI
ncbi:PREDICTED: adenylate kinase isoenzyme 5 [Nicrophorus vespilloides]|uniref:Adenylate kinase isoenzyme 5 n=1 Tax=Nicrophorus vespilloides TaxID=110193 RepID=A0ABM1MML1_NICVS|nr:PREDICTED: adenylate kinase isoenzyme 5 [Nicrophorus vespilloides]